MDIDLERDIDYEEFQFFENITIGKLSMKFNEKRWDRIEEEVEKALISFKIKNELYIEADCIEKDLSEILIHISKKIPKIVVNTQFDDALSFMISATHHISNI